MSNLEASITLKVSVEQFAAGINSAAASFTGAMSRIEGAAANTGSKTKQALEKIGIPRGVRYSQAPRRDKSGI